MLCAYSAPGPPSSQSPSIECTHVSEHRVGGEGDGLARGTSLYTTPDRRNGEASGAFDVLPPGVRAKLELKLLTTPWLDEPLPDSCSVLIAPSATAAAVRLHPSVDPTVVSAVSPKADEPKSALKTRLPVWLAPELRVMAVSTERPEKVELKVLVDAPLPDSPLVDGESGGGGDGGGGDGE